VSQRERLQGPSLKFVHRARSCAGRELLRVSVRSEYPVKRSPRPRDTASTAICWHWPNPGRDRHAAARLPHRAAELTRWPIRCVDEDLQTRQVCRGRGIPTSPRLRMGLSVATRGRQQDRGRATRPTVQCQSTATSRGSIETPPRSEEGKNTSLSGAIGWKRSSGRSGHRQPPPHPFQVPRARDATRRAAGRAA